MARYEWQSGQMTGCGSVAKIVWHAYRGWCWLVDLEAGTSDAEWHEYTSVVTDPS